MRRGIGGASVAVTLMLLAGCQTAKIDPTAGGGGLAGRWAPDGGGYTAIFNNGSFQTLATDTGNVISQGSYLAQSVQQVDLNWTSNITGQPNSASCQRPNANLLTCTDAGGKAFTLRRVAS